jgi:hypothetical protein
VRRVLRIRPAGKLAPATLAIAPRCPGDAGAGGAIVVSSFSNAAPSARRELPSARAGYLEERRLPKAATTSFFLIRAAGLPR